jgi:hypothetical protein
LGEYGYHRSIYDRCFNYLFVVSKQVIGMYLDVQNPDNAGIIAIALPLLVIAAIAKS